MVLEDAAVGRPPQRHLANRGGIDALLRAKLKASASDATPTPVMIWLQALATGRRRLLIDVGGLAAHRLEQGRTLSKAAFGPPP